MSAGHSEVRRTVEQVWVDVFKVAVLKDDDDFFALGGDSLAAIEIAERLSGALYRQGDQEMLLFALFDHPRLADFARAIT